MELRHFILFILLGALFDLNAQVYQLDEDLDGSGIVTCSGTFTDSGGIGDPYQPDEDYTVTFCSDSGDPLIFDFELDTEDVFDVLNIYDGPTTSSPIVAGSPFGGSQSFSVQSSGLCLTFQFSTGSINEFDGWVAEISCDSPAECPDGEVQAADPACEGATTSVFVALTGTAPWTIAYSIDGVLQPPFISSDALSEITDVPPGLFNLLSVTDDNCQFLINEVTFIPSIPAPTMGSATDLIEVCTGDLADISLDLGGTGPFSIEYLIDGVPQPTLIAPTSPFTLADQSIGQYEFLSIEDVNCTNTDIVEVNIEEISGFDATISGDVGICPGTFGPLNVESNIMGAWTFDLILDGVFQQTIDAIGSPIQVNVDEPGTYTIDNIDAGTCIGTGMGQAEVTLNDIPSVMASFQDDTLCLGESTILDLQFEGTAPWDLNVSIDGSPPIPFIFGNAIEQISDLPAGTYTIVGLADAVCGVDLDLEFVVIEQAGPTIILDGNPSEFCPDSTASQELMLTGTGPWTLEYSIDFVDQPALIIDSSPFTWTGLEEGFYSLTSISDENCSSTIFNFIDVQALPSPSLTLSADQAICPGEMASLNVAADAFGDYSFEYLLDGVSQGSLVFTGVDFDFEVNSPGQYTITAVSDDNCPGQGNGMAEVTIASVPSAQFGTSIDICPSGQGTLELILTGTAPWNIDYSIDDIPQTGVTALASPFQLPVSQDGEYEITNISDAACSSEPLLSQSVGLLPTPEANIMGDALICPGSSTPLDIDLIGNGPFDFDLLLNGVPTTSFTTSGDTLIEVSEAGTYALSNISDQICPGAAQGQAEIMLQQAIALDVSNDTTVCSGSAVTLVGIPSGGLGAPYSSYWLADGDSIIGNTFTFIPSETQIASFVASDACAFPYSTQVAIAVQDLSVPGLISESNVQCSEDLLFLDTESPLGSIAETCVWTVGGVSYIGCEAQSVLLDSTGVYDVELTITSALGCDADTVFMDAVQVSQNPIAEFSVLPEVADNIQSEINIDNHSTGAVSYEWFLDSVAFSTEVEPSFELETTLGDVQYDLCLVVTNEAGCTDTLCKPQLYSPQVIVNVPNAFTPDGDDINESFAPIIDGPVLSEYHLEIFDRVGRKVWETFIPEESWNGQGASSESYYAGDSVYQWVLELRGSNSVEKLRYSGIVTMLR